MSLGKRLAARTVERKNPDYANAVRIDNTIDAPLFDSARSLPAVHPAPVLRDSMTSREAWQYMLRSGLIDERQAQVLQIIAEQQPITRQQIAEELHMPINCITPRVLELIDEKALVVEDGFQINEISGRRRAYLKLRPQ